MRCKDTKELLSAMLDGELTSAERGAVDQHLKECAACQERLAELQQLNQALDTVPRVSVSSEFGASLKTRMAASKHPFYHPKVWVEAVAAAIVIIAVGVGLFVDPPAAPVDNAEPTAAVEIMNLDLLSDPQFLGTERFSYDQVFPGSAEMTLPTFNFNGQETEEGGLS